MMRLTMAVWWSLALVWLVTSQADAEPTLEPPVRLVEIKGYGPSTAAAKKDALREALQRLQAEGQQHQLDHWQPTDANLQGLLDGAGHAGPDIAIDNLPPSKTWVLQLRLPSDEQLRQFERHGLRRQTAASRMGLALRVLAALAATIAVLVGCIRLDEWTRSRYTAWLRVAGAAAIVAVLGVGWWSMG